MSADDPGEAAPTLSREKGKRGNVRERTNHFCSAAWSLRHGSIITARRAPCFVEGKKKDARGGRKFVWGGDAGERLQRKAIVAENGKRGGSFPVKNTPQKLLLFNAGND